MAKTMVCARCGKEVVDDDTRWCYPNYSVCCSFECSYVIRVLDCVLYNMAIPNIDDHARFKSKLRK